MLLGEKHSISWHTKLTREEITWMSNEVGADWDKLAGLMNIPYGKRQEIRSNSSKYPTFSLKAEQIFVHFNQSRFFSRHDLKRIFKELGRHDLEIAMIPVKTQVFHIDYN